MEDLRLQLNDWIRSSLPLRKQRVGASACGAGPCMLELAVVVGRHLIGVKVLHDIPVLG